MTRPTLLTDVVAAITLPERAVAALDVVAPYVVDPLCSPSADVDACRRRLSGGERDVQRLLAAAGTRPADAAVIGALVVSQAPRVDVDVDGDAVVTIDQTVHPWRGQVCVPGSLHVHGDLSVQGPLLVCGDLVVDGTLRDRAPLSMVVVLGSLRCRTLITSGMVLVGSDLEASAFVFAHNDATALEVVGTLQAPAVVVDDAHAIEVGALEVEHEPDDNGRFFTSTAAHRAALRELVADPAVVGERIDIKAWAAAARQWR